MTKQRAHNSVASASQAPTAPVHRTLKHAFSTQTVLKHKAVSHTAHTVMAPSHNLILVSAFTGATLLIVIASLVFWRLNHSQLLESTYTNLKRRWLKELMSTASLEQKLRSTNHSIDSASSQFAGATATFYSQAAATWSGWLQHREECEAALASAQTLFHKHLHREWWQTSLKHLESAIAILTTGTARLLETQGPEAASAEADLKRFNLACQIANGVSCEIENKLSGTENESLDTAMKKLHKAQLPIAPYLERIEQIRSQAKIISQQVLSDPLTEHDNVCRAWHQTVDALVRELLRALTMKVQLESAQTQFQAVQTRLADLRNTAVDVGFPGAESIGNFTLSEAPCQPDPIAATVSDLLAHLHQLLCAGRLAAFDSEFTPVPDIIGSLTPMIDQALADKAQVDEVMTAIISQSTAADLQADQSDRQQILDLYIRQEWAKAHAAAEILRLSHEQRQHARKQVEQLAQQLALIDSEIKTQPTCWRVSAAVDETLAMVTQQSISLSHAASRGSGDWPALASAATDLSAQIQGEHTTSLRQRLQAELSAYDQALNKVSELSELKSDLIAKIKDGWGGKPASEHLDEDKCHWISTIIEQLAVPKQNWLKLAETSAQAILSLAPAAILIGEEIALSRETQEQLRSCQSISARCKKSPYTRTIAGVQYGDKLICPTHEADAHLARAVNFWEARLYESALAAIKEARLALARVHLQCWWLCFQMLSTSSDSCVRDFLWSQGYEPGMFEQWSGELLQKAQNGAIYEAPQIFCNHSLQKAKPLPIELPPVSDYNLAL